MIFYSTGNPAALILEGRRMAMSGCEVDQIVDAAYVKALSGFNPITSKSYPAEPINMQKEPNDLSVSPRVLPKTIKHAG